MSDTRYAPPSIADAFTGNRLLATFPDDLKTLIEGRIELVELDLGRTVLRRGTEVGHSLFPFGATMISMVVDLEDGVASYTLTSDRDGPLPSTSYTFANEGLRRVTIAARDSG